MTNLYNWDFFNNRTDFIFLRQQLNIQPDLKVKQIETSAHHETGISQLASLFPESYFCTSTPQVQKKKKAETNPRERLTNLLSEVKKSDGNEPFSFGLFCIRRNSKSVNLTRSLGSCPLSPLKKNKKKRQGKI